MEDIGDIRRISLPDGFVESASQDNVNGDSALRRFCKADDEEVRICFFYRGYAVNQQTSSHFRALLESPPHQLGRLEVAQLADVFGHKANDTLFSIQRACTETVAQRTVLMLDGSYPVLGENNCTMYLDSDGSGRFVQEVFLQTPLDRYNQYREQFAGVLSSIEWK